MRNINEFLTESLINTINEGGAAGHMAHPIDFNFTARDLKKLISDIFSGKIEDVTEKIDGNNIQATMNSKGEVVFIRNGSDLNSERGGMTIEDMAIKWADKKSVADTFITAGKIIKKVFTKLGVDFFNPDDSTRLIVNCECVNEGVTNIIPYASALVSFHDIWVYKRMIGRWDVHDITKKGLDKIESACEGVDNAKLTPKVIIELTEKSNEMIEKYHGMIDELFGRDENMSITNWKYIKFNELLTGKWSWIKSNDGGVDIFFKRWFEKDKKVNLRDIKKMYPDHASEIDDIEKSSLYKEVVDEITEPLDTIFMKLGNDVLRMCGGLLNGSKNDNVIKKLQDDMRKVVKDVKSEGSSSAQMKLVKQLKRLERLGGDSSINSVEGIVFKYQGKLMKLTGSFAPLNQILGSIKFSK